MEKTIKNIFEENHDIYFIGEVDEAPLSTLIKDIRAIKTRDDNAINANAAALKELRITVGEQERPEINLYLSTYGGSVYDGLGIYDVIKSLAESYVVNVIVTGKAMSCGLFILQAGTRRYGSKNSTYLYHDISGFQAGKLKEIKESSEEWTRLKNKIDDIILSRTNITREMLDDVTEHKKDWFFDAETALQLGVIDKIID